MQTNRLMTTSLLVTLLFANSAMAETSNTSKPDCKSVVAACKKVIAAADKAISDSKKALDDCQSANQEALKQTERLAKDLANARDETGKWYHDPAFIGPMGAGVALGLTVSPLIFISVPVLVVIGIFK